MWLDTWNALPFTDEDEQIDAPALPGDADIAASMRDLARTNKVFGNTFLVVRHVARLLNGVPRGTHIRILDIATGSADIPNALLTWGERRGLKLSLVGVDSNPVMLHLARHTSPQTQLVQADALRLPFTDGAFDVALCSLAFHHVGFDNCAGLLRAMDKLTTRGFVVSDLRRDRLSLLAVQIGMRLVRAHPYTRHDGPTSVRRAFTLREYEKLVALSGVRNIAVRPFAHLRVALVQTKPAKAGI